MPTFEINASLKKRFAKDMNLPIAVFDEPYFMQRLKVTDKIIPCLNAWKTFLDELSEFNSEQDYFEYYNSVKEAVINSIKVKKEYIRFNESNEVMRVIKGVRGTKRQNLYIPANNGKCFLSIDMRKANFSALRAYDANIFDNCDTWESFIGQFTEMRHIINSKYIRQVIMGALNPGRQVGYEKHLMTLLNETIQTLLYTEDDHEANRFAIEYYINDTKLYSLANDEIIFICDDPVALSNALKEILPKALKYVKPLTIDMFRFEPFRLNKIPFDVEGYLKSNLVTGDMTFKCVEVEYFHQVAKRYLGEEITDDDLVFRHNHRLAKFLRPIC